MASPKVYRHSVESDSWRDERPFIYFDYNGWGTFTNWLDIGWGTAVAPKYKVGNWTYTGTGKVIFPMNGIYTIRANAAWGPGTAGAVAIIDIAVYDAAGTVKTLSPCAEVAAPVLSIGYFAGSAGWTGYMGKGEMAVMKIYNSGSAAQVLAPHTNFSIVYTGGLAV